MFFLELNFLEFQSAESINASALRQNNVNVRKDKWLRLVEIQVTWSGSIGPTTNQQVAERAQHSIIFFHNLTWVDIVAWNFSFSILKEMPTFLFSLKATRLVYLVEELPCRNNRAVGHAVTFDISIVVMTNIRRKTKENVPALISFLFYIYKWQKYIPNTHIS